MAVLFLTFIMQNKTDELVLRLKDV